MIERILPREEIGYSMPTEVIFGRDALKGISEEQPITGAQRVILVSGSHFKKSGEFDYLKAELGKNGRGLVVYEDLVKTSDCVTVDDLTKFVREDQPDVIVAVGGGTILDCAKCAAILAKNPGRVEDFFGGQRKLEVKGVDSVAVPTTAGTGSEVTPWATVWDTLKKEKHSLSSPLMFPSLAVVDPSLTDELPAKITAETGMDALTQAIEAYWSKSHNPVSDKYALEAIQLAMKYLPLTVNSPVSEARDMMSKASLFAGLAFSNTKTTICHAVSYPITIHWGIVHGQAVSVTLPKMIEYSLPSLEKERSDALLSAIGVETIEEAVKKIENLMKSIDLATRLSELGIVEKDLEIIINEGYNFDRMNNAPRIPSNSILKKLLKSLL